jgi:hypothetical protein
MLHQQLQTVSMWSNVREKTRILLVNIQCSQMLCFWETCVSSGLAVRVTLTRVSLRMLDEFVTPAWACLTILLYRSTLLFWGSDLNFTLFLYADGNLYFLPNRFQSANTTKKKWALWYNGYHYCFMLGRHGLSSWPGCQLSTLIFCFSQFVL